MKCTSCGQGRRLGERQVTRKLYTRCGWKGDDKGSTGVVTLPGGTGPFAGIKGKGRFDFVALTQLVNWDDIEWAWEMP